MRPVNYLKKVPTLVFCSVKLKRLMRSGTLTKLMMLNLVLVELNASFLEDLKVET